MIAKRDPLGKERNGICDLALSSAVFCVAELICGVWMGGHYVRKTRELLVLGSRYYVAVTGVLPRSIDSDSASTIDEMQV